MIDNHREPISESFTNPQLSSLGGVDSLDSAERQILWVSVQRGIPADRLGSALGTAQAEPRNVTKPAGRQRLEEGMN